MQVAVFDTDKNTNLRQSNFLIEARYKLTTQEFRIIRVIMATISQFDEDFKEYKINLIDLKELLESKSESLVADLKKATQGLLSKPLIIINGNQTIQMNWISSAKYEKGKSYVIIKLDPELKPYLLKIRSHYTDFELQELLSLKSFYASRIYELMKQFAPNIKKRKFSVDELQKMLGCDYPNYGNFKDRVLKSAILEINNKTGLLLEFDEIKSGRKVSDIIFNIHAKNDPSRTVEAAKTKGLEDKKEGEEDNLGGESAQIKHRVVRDLENIKNYFAEKKYKSEPELFFANQEKKEWKGIVNWMAAADEWELRHKAIKPDLYVEKPTGKKFFTVDEPPEIKQLRDLAKMVVGNINKDGWQYFTGHEIEGSTIFVTDKRALQYEQQLSNININIKIKLK